MTIVNDDNSDTISNLTGVTTITENFDISSPSFIELHGPHNNDYRPVVDVTSPDFEFHDTQFKVYHPNGRNRKKEVEATAENIMKNFFTKEIMYQFCFCTNDYIEKQKVKRPEMFYWKREAVCAPVTISTIYHFVAILY